MPAPIQACLGALWLMAVASPASAQNMALTPPAPTEPMPEKKPALAAAPLARPTGAELPNQRTGPARPQRVVRDICVGCDR